MSKMSRRRFIETGAKGIALASIPGFLRFSPEMALAGPTGSGGSLETYYSHFGVNETIIREVMQAALAHGGDYCDIYFQHTISSYIGLEDKAVNRAYTGVDFGVGIRVLKGDQTGFSFTEEVTPEAMKKAAATAANIATGIGTPLPRDFSVVKSANYYPIETSWESVGIDRKMPYLQKINDRLLALDNRVLKANVYFTDETSYILFVNSDGRIAFDYQPMTQLGASCTAEHNGVRERAGFNLCGRQGIDFFTDESIERIAQEAVARTVVLFDAIKPEAGEMPVVLAAGSSGILLHEAIGHGMEADFNRKNASIFADKIAKPVAEKFVSIVDDGIQPNMRGSINIDDEGNEVGKTFLVEEGTLRSYMHDRISAKHYKLKPTGSGRRQSFRHSPLPRMRNTYMLPGPHTKDEIIASVKDGLYAETFTNGQVQIGAGDFSFYVKSGYLIKDGKLDRAVKDINIIGNGPDVLTKVTMVADDLKFAVGGWTCGKGGQSVPVGMGLPTVKVSSITVSGVKS